MGTTLGIQGVNIALADATDLTVASNAVAPFRELTTGEGAPAKVFEVEDYAVVPATNFDAGSWLRLCRFPAHAKIKQVQVWSDVPLDSSASSGALELYFGVGFSDAVNDGTPSGLVGLMPKNTKDGVSVAVAATNYNVEFGSIAVPATTAKVPITDITFNGVAATYPPADILWKPQLALFGYTAGNGQPMNSAGSLDLIAVVKTAATTLATGKLFARVKYAV
jgi:hypothetical protein